MNSKEKRARHEAIELAIWLSPTPSLASKFMPEPWLELLILCPIIL